MTQGTQPFTLYIYRSTLYASVGGAAVNEIHGVSAPLKFMVWGGEKAQEQGDIQGKATKELKGKLV